MEDQAKYGDTEGATISAQERAILHLLEDELFDRLLRPICRPRAGDFSRGITDIFFDKLDYGVLSGGERAAIAWAAAIWRDHIVPDMRDPFDGFGVMSPRLQARILEAMRIRHEVDEGLRMEQKLERLGKGD